MSKLTSFWNYIQLALKSIVSYKRRSLSIGAGMVLGAAIFSSIFFYGSIVKVIAIQDVMNNIEAEVTFYPTDVGFTNPDSIAQEIEDQPEVLDTVIVYGWNVAGTSSEIQHFAYLEFTDNVSKTNQEPTFLSPKIVDENYTDSQIIQNINMYEGEIDLAEGNCLISESLFRTYGIGIGTKLPVNLTSAVLEMDDETYQYQLKEQITYLFELEVVGLFQTGRDATSRGYFEPTDVIFSSSNVQKPMIDQFNKYNFYVIATKLDLQNLPLDDAQQLSERIDIMIERIRRKYPQRIEGINQVSFLLQMSQIQIILMQLIDFILYIPAIILSIILINFGADLALQERKFEIGILKAQGASPKQVRRMIFIEVLLIGILGEIIGIGLGTVGASVVVSSTSFLSVDISQFGEAFLFLQITPASIIVPVIFSLGILLITTRKKTKKFIMQEVAVVKEIDKEKEGFFKRIYADVFALILAFVGIILAFVRELNPDIGYAGWTIFLQILSPIILWYASGSVAGRIAPKIPQVLDKYIVKVFKDIGMLIKGSLGRRHQNFPKITLLLCLSVSLAVFAAIQGETGRAHLVRQAETEVGGDMNLELGPTVDSLSASNFTGYENEIESVVPLYYVKVPYFLGGNIHIFGADLENYAENAYWHSDSFEDYDKPMEAFEENILNNPLQNVAVDENTAQWLEIEVNNTLGLQVSANKTIAVSINLVFDHVPALNVPNNEGGFKVLVDYRLLLNHFENTTTLPSAIVNVKTSFGESSNDLALDLQTNFDWIKNIETFEEVYDDLSAEEGRNFGIPGLLSINYIVALVTSIIGVFIFMMLIINRRRKEFAILTAEGASKIQIIKLVISEILSLAIFATIFGSIIGFLFAFQFNSFISFFDTIFGFGQTGFKRKLTIPVLNTILTIVSSFLAIMIATLIPAITASRVEVVEEMRVT